METTFYPVVTVETEEELEMLTVYCDEHSIDFQFLDDQSSIPSQVLLYIDKEDYDLFLKSVE